MDIHSQSLTKSLRNIGLSDFYRVGLYPYFGRWNYGHFQFMPHTHYLLMPLLGKSSPVILNTNGGYTEDEYSEAEEEFSLLRMGLEYDEEDSEDEDDS